MAWDTQPSAPLTYERGLDNPTQHKSGNAPSSGQFFCCTLSCEDEGALDSMGPGVAGSLTLDSMFRYLPSPLRTLMSLEN